MELLKNQKKTIDSSAKVFGVSGSLAIKDKPTLGDKLSIPSFGYKTPVHKLIYKNGVHINCDNNDNTGSTDKTSTFPKKAKFIALKNIKLKDLQQNCQNGECINIQQAGSKLILRPVCPHCRKILTTKETLASHFQVCKQLYNFACEKCSFVTWNKSDLDSHKALHAPIGCPKCSLVFENMKSFTLHYRKFCQSRTENIHTCKVCAFSCTQMHVLESHMKLHPADSESVQLERNTFPPKEVNNKFGQGVLVVTAKSLYAKEYDDVADQSGDPDSLPPRAQSNSVDQNIVSSSLSTNRDHDYSKTEGIAFENPKCLNKHVDMSRKESSISEIVCTNEGLNLAIDKNSLSKKKSQDKIIVRYCGKCKRDFDIGCYYEERPMCDFCDSKVQLRCTLCDKLMKEYFEAVEHSKSECDKQKRLSRHRQVEVSSKRKSLRQTDNSSNLCINKIPSSKDNDYREKIVRHCAKCNEDFDFGSYYEQRPRCEDCQTKLQLKCILCDKLMNEYFIAVEHTELKCDQQETLYRHRQVELPSKRKTLRQTDNSSNLGINNIPSSKYNDYREKIVRHCEKCNEDFDFGCYYEQRPHCEDCQTKLQLKCILCDKLMNEYFIAVEHTELKCDQQERLNTEQQIVNSSLSKERDQDYNEKQCIVNSSFSQDRDQDYNEKQCIVNSSLSQDRDQDYNETEKERTSETTKQRNNHRDDNIKSGKVTKICRTCNITTEFDVTKSCKTCYRKCTFRCNRCKKDFENYQKVSKHVLTQCSKEGFYHCLKCDFKSPTKLTVRRHCEKDHPEFSDPLGSAKETDYIEYRAFQSDNNACQLSQNLCFQPKLRKSIKPVNNNSKVRGRFSRTCQHCETTFRSHRRYIKHLIRCMKPRAFACKNCSFAAKSKLNLRNHALSCHLNLPSINADSLVNSFIGRSNAPGSYKCRFCNHVSQRRTALQMHEGRVHLKELLVLEESKRNKGKIYQCNACSCKIVDKLGELKQHILRIHTKGQDTSKLPPCAKCGWDFQSCWGLKKHLAYCGKKLYMQCRVNLVRLTIKPAVLSENLANTIKEEAVDLGEFNMEVET